MLLQFLIEALAFWVIMAILFAVSLVLIFALLCAKVAIDRSRK